MTTTDNDRPGATEPDEAGEPGSGPDDLIGAADAAVAKLKAGYLDWLSEDIAKLREALVAATAEPAERKGYLDRAYAVSHDVKGQGGTFGFDLVTTVGHSLCDFIKNGRAETETGLAVVEAHIAAIETIAREEIEGDGGKDGRILLDRLADLVENTR